jgi:hypothetical protein
MENANQWAFRLCVGTPIILYLSNPHKRDAGDLIWYNIRVLKAEEFLINLYKLNMEPTNQDYKQMLTEIIKKQIVILGPQIAVLKARGVPGLKVSDEGDVLEVSGPEQVILQKLIDEYVALSGEIVKNAVNSIFAKYPSIQH